MKTRVVITGIGLTSPLGNNLCEFRENLLKGKSGIVHKEIPHMGIVAAGLCNFDENKYQSKKLRKRGTRVGAISIYCANEALLDANIEFALVDKSRVGIYIGITEHGNVETENEVSQLYKNNLDVGLWSHHHNPRTVSNTPAGEVSINLSQSATSTSLKTLSHYGAIETIESREKRAQIHSAKLDMLAVVSAIFSKRDQEDILGLKKMAKKILQENNVGPKSEKRLESIVLTCEIAESVMNFVMGLSQKQIPESYPQIIKRLPKVLDLLTHSVDISSSFKDLVNSKIFKKSSSGNIYEN